MIWFLLLALIVLVAVVPFVVERRRATMDENARVDAPGDFAELSQGVTHYQWIGGVRGPVAICVHGLVTPGFVWQPIAERLAGMGYRVLIYDLYGRGYSDRPEGDQDDAFFVQQLEDLVADQQVGDDVTMFGYSMGGVVAAAYAAKHPEQLRQLVLLAPAGFGGFPSGLYRTMGDLPYFGDWLARTVFPRKFRQGSRALSRNHPRLKEAAVAQSAQLKWRGFIPAVVSSLRNVLRDPRETEHRKLSRVDVPVLAIWATADDVIPLSGMGNLTQWNRIAVQTQVEGATHLMPLTHPDEVVAAFRDGRH